MATNAIPPQEQIKISLANSSDFARIHAIDSETNISPWTVEQVKSSFNA